MAEQTNSKRKREDRDERKPKDRKIKMRQDAMEEEFAATFHGLTSLYKLLEIKHLQSPLFLPRTLSFRLAVAKQSNGSSRGAKTNVAKDEIKKSIRSKSSIANIMKTTADAGATLKEFVVSMTADTIEIFRRENQRVALRIAAFATANTGSFRDNEFLPIGSCLIPVPCSKEMTLPREFLRPRASIYVLTFQLVEIGDMGDQLQQQATFSFTAPMDSSVVRGQDLLKTAADGRAPLFGNLLRLNIARRRMGQYNVELPALAGTVHGVDEAVKIQFRLLWDPLPKDKKMSALTGICQKKFVSEHNDMQLDDKFTLAVPTRLKPSAWNKKEDSSVWFHYLYHKMMRRMSEKRLDYSCVWCNMYAGTLRGLIAHLVCSHSLFRFQVIVGHDNRPHIFVMTGKALDTFDSDTSVSSCEWDLNHDDGMDRIEQHLMYISPTKRYGRGRGKSSVAFTGEDIIGAHMQEFDELDELRREHPQEFYAPLLQRQYFHSRTGAVVLEHEKDYDSDDDVDDEWITKQSERLLDEFEDVSLEEKEFMKKWNRHTKKFRILADFMMASACRLFAKLHGKWLIEHGLRYNFLLHLFNLWDNSLLNSRAIIDCMLIVDSATSQEDMNEKPTDLRQSITAK